MIYLNTILDFMSKFFHGLHFAHIVENKLNIWNSAKLFLLVLCYLEEHFISNLLASCYMLLNSLGERKSHYIHKLQKFFYQVSF
jgi:hypothetical protein